MIRKKRLIISLALLILAATVVVVGLSSYYTNLPERLSQHETIVLGQSRLVPGSEAALRVVVRDTSDTSPLPGSTIRISMKPAKDSRGTILFEGETNDLGTADVQFTVPETEETEQLLIVETQSKLGSDELEQPVTVARDYRILLTTDKPIYQPGQMIHLRALALSTFDLRPAVDEPIEFVIADGKGNKVFREEAVTSEFGVASVDFQLANQVNSGNYKISAVLGNTTSESTVVVEHYVLPKYEIKLETEQAYYLPGEQVVAHLDADYFFGKPVEGGDVLVEGFTFDVNRNEVFSIQGETDAEGQFSFEFDLPAYIAGSDLEGGLGSFYLQAAVTDQTNHTESSSLSFPVTSSQLIIEAVPESGQLRPGVENILYVLTSYPDGSPAATDIEVVLDYGSERYMAETGRYGLAEVRFTPESPWQTISITARDSQGATYSQDFYFEQAEWQEVPVLLRPDKPVYQVGETMALTILAPQGQGTAYLDIVREGQTISTRAIDLHEGEGQALIDLSPDHYGTLELHAYKIQPTGTIVRDTRLVVVDQADALTLDFESEQPVYRPGDTAAVDIQVSGRGGGVKAAMGVAIVDESVFALVQQDPGFAKLYFMLEQELLQPKYDLHGFSIPDMLINEPVDDSLLRTAQEGAAQASLSEASAQASSFTLQANSHDQAIRRVAEQQRSYFDGLSKVLMGLVLIIPLVVMGVSIASQAMQKQLWRSLGVTLVLILLLIMAFGVGIFSELFDWLFYQAEGFIVLFAISTLISFLGLAVYAWRRRDAGLGISLALVLLFVILILALFFALDKSGWYPTDALASLALISILFLPLAYLLRSAGFGWQKQLFPTIAAFFLALFLMVAPLALAGAGSSFAFNSAPEVGLLARQGGFADAALDGAPPEGEMMVFEEAEMAMEAPAEAPAADEAGAASGQAPPRLRQYFPETMLWLPDAVTDDEGLLQLDIPVADSITTWRLTALASSQDGRLGSANTSLRVFQDFFIDLDLPLALTVGDEVAIPVGVFNYLEEAQSVRLELEEATWFELVDESNKELDIAANDIEVVYFRIKALDFGRQPFKVTAWGSQMSDAIQKEVRVFPDGKEIRSSRSDRLNPGTTVQQTITIPAEAIPGTQGLTVKIYPGVVSQVVEGLDSILRMPNGCFEQTSSTTYPNVLVLDYLKTSGQASPKTQFKAEDYINLGYQRLTTFEVAGGGFSLFGNPPSDRMLTAYGLQEFSDMSRVHQVDPALVERAARWLLSQQAGDGSWENDTGLVHESSWSNLQNDRLPVTAYIVWSLVEAGFADEADTQRGLAYIREFQGQAEDPYALALVANAMVAADLAVGEGIQSSTESVLDRLAAAAILEGNGAIWQSGVATFIGSEGQTGSIETTALTALAFLRSDSHPELANAALTSLIQQKDSFGTWHNTQATILALKALIETVRSGAENVDATVTVSLNGGQSRTIEVSPENFDVVQLVSFDDVRLGDNDVSIEVAGEGNLMYQITNSYYLPWDKLALYPEVSNEEELVTIDVEYDRTELVVDDTVNVKVTVSLNEPGARAEWALIDLGIPPGFSVMAEDLNTLVAVSSDRPLDSDQATIERYELTGRQILVYIGKLSAEQPLSFSYRLQAKYPLEAQTPASTAYDYYNPDVAGEAQPQLLVVSQ